VGKHIIVVTNLQLANLRGQESQGMLLAGGDDDEIRVLEAPSSKPGEQVFFDDGDINQEEISFDDFKKIDIRIKEGKAVFGNQILRTAEKEIVCDVKDGSKVS